MVRALANLRDSGNDITYDKSTPVSLGAGEPYLELYESSELVASSEAEVPDPHIGCENYPEYPDTALTAYRGIGLDRGNNVFLLRQPDQVNTIIARVTDFWINNNTIDIKIKTSLTDPAGITVPLQNIGYSLSGQVYEGAFKVGPYTDPNIYMIGTKAKRQNTYSYYDATSEWFLGNIYDSEVFCNLMQQEGFTQLGGIYHGVNSGKKYDPAAPPCEDGLYAAGYEDLITEYKDKKAWVRLKNQATIFYYSGHGAHDSASITTFDRYDKFIIPSNFAKYWNDNLKRVVFSCCSVLDIGNFNEWKEHIENRKIRPGKLWYDATKGKAVLLGYNYVSPLSEKDFKPDAGIYRDFHEKLKGRHSTATPEEVALAWVYANAEYMHGELESDNACAIQGDWYYFISYRREKENSIMRNKYREIYKVHKKFWEFYFGRAGFDKVVKYKGAIRLEVLPDK
jgi:hypothetical protein